MKPMLASPVNFDLVNWPMFISPKLDGIRCIIKDGVALSRSLKPIRNEYVQSIIGNTMLNGLDGELIVGPINAPNAMQATSSGVMSKDGEPDFTFVVFDCWSLDANYATRLRMLQTMPENQRIQFRVKILKQIRVESELEARIHHENFCDSGYEGSIIRSMTGPYKHGRSTAKEGLLLKLVDWDYDEAEVIGFEELMHNENEQTRDALGYAERSTSKEGLVSSGMLGAFVVKSLKWEQPFNVSAGSLTLAERKQYWNDRAGHLGKLARFKHKPHGQKDVPRIPIFAGFRDEDDI